MFKQLMIGIFAVSCGVIFLWTDANAGCAVIGGTPMCASWITGSGMPTGLLTQKPDANNVPPPSDNEACSGVFTSQGDVNDPFITLTLAGTVKTDNTPCGLGNTQSRDCDIQGTAVCGHSVKKNVTTPGPLGVGSPGFAQSDGSTNSANFRFQLDSEHQAALCPGDAFIAFFAKEGFYEACLDDGVNFGCVREFCTADLGGIQADEPRVLHCKPI